jgi:hypothetical protein
MELLTTVSVALFVATTAIKTLSASYFEVALSIANRLFPDGHFTAGNLSIPNHNVATLFYPKWLHKGGHVSNWIQYLLVVPTTWVFGWGYGIAYLLAVLLGVKLLMSALSTSAAGISVSVALMRAYLERRVRLRQFRWDEGTSEEGQQVFEALYRAALELLEQVPERANA